MSALYNRAKSSAKAGCVHLEQPSRRTPEANRRDAAEYEAALNSGDAAKVKDVYKRASCRLARVLPYDLVAFPDPMHAVASPQRFFAQKLKASSLARRTLISQGRHPCDKTRLTDAEEPFCTEIASRRGCVQWERRLRQLRVLRV